MTDRMQDLLALGQAESLITLALLEPSSWQFGPAEG